MAAETIAEYEAAGAEVTAARAAYAEADTASRSAFWRWHKALRAVKEGKRGAQARCDEAQAALEQADANLQAASERLATAWDHYLAVTS